jgi:L-fuconolactonase
VHDEPDADWLLRADVRRGLQAVAGPRVRPAGPRQELPAPGGGPRAADLRFVVDHVAKPPIRAGDLAIWAERLAQLGGLPNAWCKVSGLVTEADWSAWTVDDLRPAVDHALDVFGPGRLVFGSDWPVCLLAAPYQRVVDAVRTLILGLSADEQAAVMGGNAIEVYGLAVR